MSMGRAQGKGFTLVETLVAIAILLIAVAGPLLAASRASVLASVSRDEMTASYLAQEGVEYVRAMRDDEYLGLYPSGDPDDAWNNFLNGTNAASMAQCHDSWCTLDPSLNMGTAADGSLSMEPCATPQACAAHALYPNTSGVYTRTVNSNYHGTIFVRTIMVQDISGTSDSPAPYPEKEVISAVYWNSHGTTYNVTVRDHLTPWQ